MKHVSFVLVLLLICSCSEIVDERQSLSSIYSTGTYYDNNRSIYVGWGQNW